MEVASAAPKQMKRTPLVLFMSSIKIPPRKQERRDCLGAPVYYSNSQERLLQQAYEYQDQLRNALRRSYLNPLFLQRPKVSLPDPSQ
jgi:hypothetical protein